MIKFVFYLVVIAVVILVMTGMIEITLHTDRLGQVPGKIQQFVTQPGTWEKARVLFARGKRAIEQMMAKDPQRKLELTLLYVKEDAGRLNDLIEKKPDTPEAIVPQAELLVDSMKALQEKSAKASLETITQLQDKSREAFTAATQALEHLKTVHSAYEAIRERLTSTTKTLEEQIKEFVLPKASTIVSPKPTPSPTPIPLRF